MSEKDLEPIRSKLRTVDDEDVGGAGIDTGDINEVDVVLSEGHDGVVVASVWRGLNIVPTERRAVCGSQSTHIEGEKFALRHGI